MKTTYFLNERKHTSATHCVLLLLLPFFGLLAACGGGGGDDPDPDPAIPVTVTLNPLTVAIPATGGESTISVTTTADWSAASNQGWLTVTKESSTSLKIQAEANTTGNDRPAKVTFTAGTATASVNVTQAKLSAMQADSLALIALYNATAGSNWTTKWNLATPVKQWHGVTVTNNRVTMLKLGNNNLNGTFPEAITTLSELQYMDVCRNALNGALPAAINNLTKITYFDISENQFTGAVPTVSNLTKLVLFDASVNGFTGPLPASLSNAVLLEYLAFHKNAMNDALPAAWKTLVKLNYLDVSGNDFSGAIPADWSTLTKMQAFYLYKNSLHGTIPAYLTTFPHLKSLALDGNNLSGSIPAALGDIPALEELWLAKNQLTDVIPNSLLNNSHWSVWEENVCPQQSGYGFTNCTPSPAPAQSKACDYHPRLAKEKYRK